MLWDGAAKGRSARWIDRHCKGGSMASGPRPWQPPLSTRLTPAAATRGAPAGLRLR